MAGSRKEETTLEAVLKVEQVVMKWLMRDYQRRHLRAALRKAWRAWARTHADWAAMLFDEHFVLKRVLPRFEEAAAAGEHVTPEAIAQLWAAQFSILPTERQGHIKHALPAATCFLHLAAAELADRAHSRAPVALIHPEIAAPEIDLGRLAASC